MINSEKEAENSKIEIFDSQSKDKSLNQDDLSLNFSKKEDSLIKNENKNTDFLNKLDDKKIKKETEEDYSNFKKEQFIILIRELSQNDDVLYSEKKSKILKFYFDKIRNTEKNDALQKFLSSGGEKKDFEFRSDELTERFDANYKLIRDKKNNFLKNQEQSKLNNLKKKKEVLTMLREFVESEETNIEYDNFKKIQTRWKEIGEIPSSYQKEMWANYNALVNRFYDNRSIYFELKELDRRKNLSLKIKLCEKAEELSQVEDLNRSISLLNELHEEFKHIGPVPNEDREALWDRFKTASDVIHEKRKLFQDKLNIQFEENLKKKKELVKELEQFSIFDSKSIHEWKEKTELILNIKKNWEEIGLVPKGISKKINKNFWSLYKKFFYNKKMFFKKLDELKNENYEKKKQLIINVEELKDNTDWNETAQKLKQLQQDWKKIGHVPEKYRDSLYKKFKNSCDHFFEKMRGIDSEEEKQQAENYEEKKNIILQINDLIEKESDNLEEFRNLQQEFLRIGFVPKDKIAEIKSQYADLVDKFINSLDNKSNIDRMEIRFENELLKIQSSPNFKDKLYRKHQFIKNKILQIENDIAVWNNNIEFFANTKNADKLKLEVDQKIKNGKNQLNTLRKQLQLIKNYS